mgnify:CR=1 FL=1
MASDEQYRDLTVFNTASSHSVSSMSISQRVLFVQWVVVGVCFFIVLFCSIFFGIHSTLNMAEVEGGSVPKIVESNVAVILVMMSLGFFGVSVYAAYKFKGKQVGLLAEFTDEHASLFVKVSTIPGYSKAMLVVFIPLFSLIEFTTFSPLFFSLELPLLVCFAVVSMTLGAPHHEQALKDSGAITDEITPRRRESARRLSLRRASQAITGIEHAEVLIQSKEERRKYLGLKQILGFLMNVLICVGYPFTVITLFRSVDVIGRMLIVLFLHPLIMEFLMHGYRAKIGYTTNWVGEDTEIAPMRDLMSVFMLER